MKEIYDSIEPGYYHYAMTKGSNIQRFWHRKKFEKIIKKLNVKGASILDLGCGPGTLISMIPKGYKVAYGVDISEKQISFAKNKFKKLKNVKWIAGDLSKIKLKRKEFFDYVILAEVIEHIEPKAELKILKDCFKVLKKGGKLIITTPNYRSLWPVVEFFWNKMNPIDYSEQHINRIKIEKLTKRLKGIGFREIKVGSFFFVSPFSAVASVKLANLLKKIEDKAIGKLGLLYFIEVTK